MLYFKDAREKESKREKEVVVAAPTTCQVCVNAEKRNLAECLLKFSGALYLPVTAIHSARVV